MKYRIFHTKKIIFFLFSIFYLLTASIFQLPFNSILRWIGPCLLWGYVIVSRERFIIPKYYIFIFISFIPTILGISNNAYKYSMERIISWILVCLGIVAFFSLKKITKEMLKEFYEIFTFITGTLIVIGFVLQNTEGNRLVGVYANANFLSCISTFSAISSGNLVYSYKNKNLKRCILYLIYSSVSIISVFQTGSRMGVVCIVFFLLACPFVLCEHNNVRKRLKQIVVVVILFCILYYVFSHFKIMSIERLIDGLFSNGKINSAVFTREDSWKDVYDIFNSKPFFGWGYGQVGYQCFVSAETSFNWGMHNSYFVILCEMGLIGSILFLFFFSSYTISIRNLIKETNINKGDMIFMKFLILTIITSLLNSYSESFLFSVGNPMSICFWFSFALLYGYIVKIKKEKVK